MLEPSSFKSLLTNDSESRLTVLQWIVRTQPSDLYHPGKRCNQKANPTLPDNLFSDNLLSLTLPDARTISIGCWRMTMTQPRRAFVIASLAMMVAVTPIQGQRGGRGAPQGGAPVGTAGVA